MGFAAEQARRRWMSETGTEVRRGVFNDSRLEPNCLVPLASVDRSAARSPQPAVRLVIAQHSSTSVLQLQATGQQQYGVHVTRQHQQTACVRGAWRPSLCYRHSRYSAPSQSIAESESARLIAWRSNLLKIFVLCSCILLNKLHIPDSCWCLDLGEHESLHAPVVPSNCSNPSLARWPIERSPKTQSSLQFHNEPHAAQLRCERRATNREP